MATSDSKENCCPFQTPYLIDSMTGYTFRIGEEKGRFANSVLMSIGMSVIMSVSR